MATFHNFNNFVFQFLLENHKFQAAIHLNPEEIYGRQTYFEKPQQPISFRYVRLRGLPFQKTKQDILNFLEVAGSVVLIMNSEGRPSGEAIVQVGSEQELKICMMKDKMYMGSRYVEIKESSEEEFQYSRSSISSEQPRLYQESYKSDGGNILKIRGLPFKITVYELMDFF